MAPVGVGGGSYSSINFWSLQQLRKWQCTETYYVEEVNLSSSNDNSTFAIQFQNKINYYVSFEIIKRKSAGASYLLYGLKKLPEKTIIWSANGNSLVQRGSKVELTIGGQLVLYDTNVQQVWATDVAASGVNYASMLDTGNFVLARQDYVNLWEKSEAKSRQEDPLLRPSMKNVLQMFGGATEVLMPPCPFPTTSV
ncbi:hypothetical protein CFP56_010423 [Quercus suber]|uniref:Bulb-type lectin domain-containing protein n=1 Tax=Quercus suber TaxID=58331 RepID=A0AAW0M7I6_QUESU